MLRLIPDHIGLFVSHTQNATQICEKEYGIDGLICARVIIDTGANEMMPDELIKILKRYLRESNQSERLVAARIGVNHHTLHYWLTSDERKFGVGRVLPQASRIHVGLASARRFRSLHQMSQVRVSLVNSGYGSSVLSIGRFTVYLPYFFSTPSIMFF
jgi:hypothetical protein